MESKPDENKDVGNDDNELSSTKNMNEPELLYWDDFTFPSPYLDRFEDTATRYFWYDDEGPVVPPSYTQEMKDTEDRIVNQLYGKLLGSLELGPESNHTITIDAGVASVMDTTETVHNEDKCHDIGAKKNNYRQARMMAESFAKMDEYTTSPSILDFPNENSGLIAMDKHEISKSSKRGRSTSEVEHNENIVASVANDISQDAYVLISSDTKVKTVQGCCSKSSEPREEARLKKLKIDSKGQKFEEKKKDHVHPSFNAAFDMGRVKKNRLVGWVETSRRRKKDGRLDKIYNHVETKKTCRSLSDVLRYILENPEENLETLKNIKGRTHLKRIERGPINQNISTALNGTNNEKLDEVVPGSSNEHIAIGDNNGGIMDATRDRQVESQTQVMVDFELIPLVNVIQIL